MKERVSFVKEYLTKSSYFFQAPTQSEKEAIQKLSNLDTFQILTDLSKIIRAIYIKNKSLIDLKKLKQTNNILESDKIRYGIIFQRTFAKNFAPGKWSALRSFLIRTLGIETNNLKNKKMVFNLAHEFGIDLLGYYIEKFENIWNPSTSEYEYAIKQYSENSHISLGKLSHPLRLAVSGQSTGPGIFDLLFILGKDEVLRRINYALKNIN
jgi:glutamyl/glutaminyl-tRNA synthetase